MMAPLTDAQRRLLAALRAGGRERALQGPPADATPLVSPLQRRLWLHDQLHPGTAVHHLPALWRLTGPLDPERLAQALIRLAEAHPALRTALVPDGARPRPILLEASAVRLEVRPAPGATDLDIARWAAAEVRAPMAADQPPLCALLWLGSACAWLLLVAHHAAVDGGSLPVLYQDLAAAWRDPARPLPSRPSFAQATRWLAAHPPAPRPAPPAAPPLFEPVVGARPFDAGEEAFELATAALEGSARALGVTPFALLLSAFVLTAARLSGRDQLQIGLPASLRVRAPWLAGVVGPLIETVTASFSLPEEGAAGDWVRAVGAEIACAARAAGAQGAAAAPELMCFHRDARGQALALEGLAVTPLALPAPQSEAALTLVIEVGDERVRCTLRHRLDRLAPTLAARLLLDVRWTLDALVPSADLAVLRGPSAPTLLALAALQPAPVPVPGCDVVAMLHAAARAHPERIAVRQGSRALTYAELVDQASSLAGALREQGVRAGDRVACCARRTPELVVALWATLTVGAVWVPVDPSHPEERRRAILSDASARLLLDDAGCRQRGPAVAPGGADPHQLAYLMFTSGSTGRPKGVMVELDQLGNFLVGMDAALGPLAGAPGTWLAVTTASFDISVLELLWTLTRGFTVVLAPELRPDERADPADRRTLGAIAAEAGATHLQCTPSLARLLLADPAFHRAARGLALWVVGGERCPPELVRAMREHAPDARLINAYGPTETTIWSTTQALDPVSEVVSVDEAVPIGRPVANTTVHVLDPALRPVPLGAPGELWIGGRGVARGYLGRAELTAERFRSVQGQRLYRTGDRVRLREDGVLLFLGRVDDQIKLRGHRIEPAEIEAVLGAQPGAGAVAVGLRSDAAGADLLVAWFTGEADPGELRARARRHLPEVMVPAVWQRLEALPLNPSGKVDRAALPYAPSAAPAREGGDLQDIVAATFARVLGLESVPLDVSFFELGGHSLSAVDAAAGLRELAPTLPLDAVFHYPTAGALAAALAALSGTQAPAPGAPPTLSYAQEQLWLLHRLAPPGLYDHAFLLELKGPAPALGERLGLALDRILARHEALRTAIVDEGGRPRAVIGEALPVPLSVVDLREAPDPRQALYDDVARRRDASFDPAHPPLFSVTLYPLDHELHALLFLVHHLVWDGASAAILGRELSALLGDPGAALPPLPLQARDHARWQRARFDGPAAEPWLAWWREALPPAPPLALLPDRTPPAAPSWEGAAVPVALSPELVAGLTALARQEGATLFMAVLAGFQLLLSRHAQQDDVRVGVPVANRNDPALADLIGYLVNVVVVRGDLSGDPSFLALLARTREATLGALAHQDLPFPRLLAELPADRSATTPLFQAMLVLQERHEAPLALPGVAVTRLPLPERHARYDVTLTLAPDGGALVGTLSYRADRFCENTARRWVEQLVQLLRHAVAAPQTRAAQLGAPPAVALPDPGCPEPQRTLHQLFLEHAARDPLAPAVLSERGAVSYGALRQAALAVGRAVSVAPPGPVLALVDAHELPAVMLGAMLAGRAVVADSPELPAARLSALVEDARPGWIVSGERGTSGVPLASLLAAGERADEDLARSIADVPLDADAYIAYTSGSTGRPKGIVGTHRGFAQLLQWQREALDLGPGRRVAVWSPVSYDAHYCELLGALCTGAAAVIPPREERRSPAAMARWVDEQRISWFQTVPSFCASWLREVSAQGCRLEALTHVTVSGEVLPPALARAWPASGLRARLINLFGPSEAVLATWHPVDAPAHEGEPVPVGRPIPGRAILLLGPDHQPVAPGAPGEIVLRTRFAARGYLDRPDETARVFAPAEGGAVLLRTGDRGRLRPDGALEFLGRADRLVKVRGNRVELGEIEAVLQGCPGVEGCRAEVRGARLLAWFEGSASAEAVRAHLAERLPASSTPDRLVWLEYLPRTATGKIDPAALLEPEIADSAPPASPLEDRIAEIWREVLAVPRVGRDDGFFELGGQSLAMAEVHARLERALQRKIPLLALFRFPTVARLAAHLHDGGNEAPPALPDAARRRAALKTLHQRRQEGR